MANDFLKVVINNEGKFVFTDEPGPLAKRVQALSVEAKALAKEHIMFLEASLIDTSRLAKEIANGGDLYPAGIRDLCSRLCEELRNSQQTIQSLREKAK